MTNVGVIPWRRLLQQLLVVTGWFVAASAGAAPVEIVIQRGHYTEVGAVAYSVDGRVIASAGAGDVIRLWDRETGDLVLTLPGHPQRVMGLAFSADGRWLASAGTEGMVKLWDYRAGRLAHLLTNHLGDWVRRVAFSPDSRWLVPATYDGKMSVWDVASGATVRTLTVNGSISDVAFTPDGKSIVGSLWAGAKRTVQFWDASTGEPGLSLDSGTVMSGLAISRDGRRLAAGGEDGWLRVWELPSGRLMRGWQGTERNRVLDVDLNGDGSRLAVTGDWTNTVWATETGHQQLALVGHEDNAMHISFSPEGDEIATSSSDATIRLWRARDGKLQRVLASRSANRPITSIAFSSDGHYEALGTADGLVRLWSASDGRFLHELRGHEEAVLALAFSVDGEWLFSGSMDRTKRVWNVARGLVSAIHSTFDRLDAMGALAAGGTEQLVASASGPMANVGPDYSIRLWESHDAWPRQTLAGHLGSVRSLAFTPGVDLLASASLDGTVKLWDTRSGLCLRTSTNTTACEGVAFEPNARWIYAGMADGFVRVLDTNHLTELRSWRAHQRPVKSIAVSKNGRWIATASSDQTVAIWDSTTGREQRRFTDVTAHHLPLAFAADRPVLAFAQRDELLVHANVETGEVLFQRVLFPDGEWMAWNPAKAFYTSSPHGDEHARVRFVDQLTPVYPLTLYREELQRGANLLVALDGPAPRLEPKNLALWWYHYPYKAVWFYGSLSLLGAWVIHRLRRGWIAERSRRMQENVSRQLIVSQEAERKRIAAELHDSLGQNLLVIKSRLYLAQRDVAVAGRAEQLEEISKSVSQSIDEVREISHNLRPYQLDRLGLTKAVQAVVRKVADSGALALESQVGPVDGLFSPEGEINFYRIVQESLNNILKHSDAASASLTIERNDRKVTMRIEDDGRGFDYLAMTSNPGNYGGFGLTSLSERVRILGGRFECDSARGKGTRLTFEIPIPTNHDHE